MISNVIKHPISLVAKAHSLIKQKVKPGDFVIDATVGNGHDTRFLLEMVKPNGKVFGFDIQQSAIVSARKTLRDQFPLESLILINACHANMNENIPSAFLGRINAVMFNLGYLPGGDKRIITQPKSTITALTAACKLLSSGAIMTVLAYPGHEGGKSESNQVKNWCLSLDSSHFRVEQFESQAEKSSAPKLFVVSKISYDVTHL